MPGAQRPRMGVKRLAEHRWWGRDGAADTNVKALKGSWRRPCVWFTSTSSSSGYAPCSVQLLSSRKLGRMSWHPLVCDAPYKKDAILC